MFLSFAIIKKHSLLIFRMELNLNRVKSSRNPSDFSILFLGTGGGRFNLLKQIRATAGFRINSKSANIHVDPGPGALLHSLRLKQDVHKLDAVIVTHYHVDHVNDAQLLVEAMSGNTLKKGGTLIGSKYTIDGDERGDRGVSLYHQGLAGQVYSGNWGEKKKIKTKKGEFEIESIRTKHDEKSFGFKLWIDGAVIGYTSDTEYYEGIGESYHGCDYLILNCLKPLPDPYHGHMTTLDVIEILKIAKPKLAILSHMGMKMIPVADKEAKKVENATGIACIAAKDGQRIWKRVWDFL